MCSYQSVFISSRAEINAVLCAFFVYIYAQQKIIAIYIKRQGSRKQKNCPCNGVTTHARARYNYIACVVCARCVPRTVPYVRVRRRRAQTGHIKFKGPSTSRTRVSYFKPLKNNLPWTIIISNYFSRGYIIIVLHN